MRADKITRVAQSAEGNARDVRHWKRRGAPLALTVLELALQQYERIGSHVGVEQCAVPVISFAAVKHQPIAHRGERLDGAWKKLREQRLRANVALPVRDGRAAAPTNSRRELRGGLGDESALVPRAVEFELAWLTLAIAARDRRSPIAVRHGERRQSAIGAIDMQPQPFLPRNGGQAGKRVNGAGQTVPAVATMAIGVRPAARSSSIAACRTSTPIRKDSSTGISPRLSRPMPKSATALGIDMCTSAAA